MALSPTLQGIVDNWHLYDAGTQLEIIRIIREFRKAEGQSCGVMPPSAVEAMAKATPDALLRDIVREQRHGIPAPASLAESSGPPKVAKPKGTGWQSPLHNEDRSRQFALMDAIVESQIGGANDTSKLR